MFYVELDTWLTGDPAPLVSGEKKVDKYHRGVAQVIQVTRTYTKEGKARCKPVLHAILTEASKRGWELDSEIKRGAYYNHPDKTLFFLLTDTGARYELSVKEIYEAVQRPPTQAEIEAHERSSSSNYPIKKFYAHIPTGRVEVSVGSFTRKDTAVKPERLNEAIPGNLR
ncbi:hypothetical protein [uncultured Corynebacterium sp.]|uniref:hypothetical protein n=1 Tax=uncultured Corynebacterium sp. TaxID=159447 RepID=UPI00288AE557|nr:hypothetical protein [uncultured Corynebacterium sp.]